MASKIGNIKDLWSNLDSCIRDKTSWIELGSAATGGYPAMLKLLAEKAQECSQDPNTQYRTAVQLAELFGQPLPKQSDFGINADGTVGGTMKTNDGRGKPTATDASANATAAHEAQAWAIAYQLLGKPCSGDIQLPGNVWDRCRPGMDGAGYTIDSSKYPLTSKQLAALQFAVKDAAALGMYMDDMLARGQSAVAAELAKLGIGSGSGGALVPGGGGEFGGGGEPSGDGTTTGARPKKSNTLAMAGFGVVGLIIALGGAYLIAQAVKAK